MSEVIKFINKMEQRYQNKNILWDTTFILESIHASIDSLESYLKNKNPDDLGELFACAFFSFKINHIIKLEEKHNFGYENTLKSIVNLYKSFEEHLEKLGKNINITYNGQQAKELLKEIYNLVKDIWLKELQKLNLNKEDLIKHAENILDFNKNTDYKELIPYFIKLCA